GISQTPCYESDGLVEIRPYVPGTSALDHPMAFYTTFVKSQAALIQGPRVIAAAMKRKEWTDAGGSAPTPVNMAFFGKCLTATWIKDSGMIQIAFVSEKTRLAKAGC